MPTSEIVYTGELSTEVTHSATGTMIRTDAPADNHGLGRCFSPTDLLCASLGSCMLTVMGIYARRSGFDISGTTATITKVMAEKPRRVAEITVEIRIMGSNIPAKHCAELEHAALHCPVAESLSSKLLQTVRFSYGKD